jgi:hypothetical protein
LGYDYNEGTSYDTLENIPASKYIDFTVRLSGDTKGTPYLSGFTLETAVFKEIVLDTINNAINFNPANKYPAENWSVKENNNSIELRFSTTKPSVVYADYGNTVASEGAGGDTVFDTEHSIILRPLKPDTEYKYRLRVFDENDAMDMLPFNSQDEASSFFSARTLKTDVGFEGGPSATNLSQVEITASTAKISWKTKVPTSSWVDYGQTADYGLVAGDEEQTTVHLLLSCEGY